MSSETVKVSQEFKDDFALFESRLREEGEEEQGIEEIKACIRRDWNDDDKRSHWEKFVKGKADAERELVEMARKMTNKFREAA